MPEWLEIYTEDGRPTGQKELRDVIHARGIWHKTVHIWIANSKGELLVQRRSPLKESHPNMWDASAAGHISFGETEREAACKELGEEIGQIVEEHELELICTIKIKALLNGGAFDNAELTDLFLLQRDIDVSSIVMQEEEVAEVKWMPWELVERAMNDADPTFVPIAQRREDWIPLFDRLRVLYPRAN